MLARDFRLVLPPWVDEVVGAPREYRGTEEKMALAIRLSAGFAVSYSAHFGRLLAMLGQPVAQASGLPSLP